MKKVALILIPVLVAILAWPINEPEYAYATVLNDRQGNLLSASIASDGQWRFPPPDSIPSKIEACILHFEDQYFYYHPGINPASVIRASFQNIYNGKIISGASTITMQLARMMRNKERNIFQKFAEAILALKLEIRYSKKEILNKYLAIAPFGGNVVGIEAASWRYFERPLHLLSWGEAAALAVLPNNPGVIFPGNAESVYIKKRDRLLFKLYENEVIDSLTYELSLLEELPQTPRPIPQKANHLLTTMKENEEGRVISTTLDPFWQMKATQIMERYHENLQNNGIDNLAAIVVDLNSSEVLAYVGNTNDQVADGHNVDIIRKPRSPGSSLKPVLYAQSLTKGIILPHTLLPDIPTFFGGFTPKNYSDGYDGIVPASEALVKSLNIPFVHLLRDYTYEQFHHDLKKLGITTLNKAPGHYGLSLILGGGEVSLWDLTNVYFKMYRQLAGKPVNSFVLKNNVQSPQESINLEPAAIWHTFHAMTNLSRPSSESQWEQYSSSQVISWKTGTSFGFRDAWAVGLNGNILVGVWVGNADGEGRPGLIGVSAAAPLFLELINLGDHDREWLEELKPKMTPSAMVCQISGMIPNPSCPMESQMLTRNWEASAACAYHQEINLDQTHEYQVNSSCYNIYKMIKKSVFTLPASIGYYYAKTHPEYQGLPPFLPDCSANDNNPIEIIYPNAQSEVFIPTELSGEKGKVVFEASHSNLDEKLFWSVDDDFLGATIQSHRMALDLEKGTHLLRVTDSKGNESTRMFSVIGEKID